MLDSNPHPLNEHAGNRTKSELKWRNLNNWLTRAENLRIGRTREITQVCRRDLPRACALQFLTQSIARNQHSAHSGARFA